MNKSQLFLYQTELWPAASAAQGWDARDKHLRRDIRRDCFEFIGVAASLADAVSAYNNAQVTALFTFLDHLAHPDHIGKMQTWEDCKADYEAFNASKQADYWQRRGGTGQQGKWVKNRFAKRRTAVAKPFTDEPLTAHEAKCRRLTMKRQCLKNEATQKAAEPVNTPSRATQTDLIPAPAAPPRRATLPADYVPPAMRYDTELTPF